MTTLDGITDLEEDVLIYGICKSMVSIFGKYYKRIEILRVFRNLEPLFYNQTVKMSNVTKNCKVTKKNQISGVVSSLSKKGLVKCEISYWGEKEITLTQKGIWVLENI